jgi:hypothetical protein
MLPKKRASAAFMRSKRTLGGAGGNIACIIANGCLKTLEISLWTAYTPNRRATIAI